MNEEHCDVRKTTIPTERERSKNISVPQFHIAVFRSDATDQSNGYLLFLGLTSLSKIGYPFKLEQMLIGVQIFEVSTRPYRVRGGAVAVVTSLLMRND